MILTPLSLAKNPSLVFQDLHADEENALRQTKGENLTNKSQLASRASLDNNVTLPSIKFSQKPIDKNSPPHKDRNRTPDGDQTGKSRDKLTAKKNSQHQGNHTTYMETSGYTKRKLTEEESLQKDGAKETHNKIVIGEPMTNLLYKPGTTSQLDAYTSIIFWFHRE